MAIAYRSAATASAPAATSVTVSKPAGTADDDILFAAIATDTDVTITAPAGWTLIRSSIVSLAQRLSTYRKIAASEGSNWVWTLSAFTNACGVVVAISGGDTSSPVDAEGGQTNSTTANQTAPAVTTSTTDTLLVYAGSVNNSSSWTPDGSMTERADLGAGFPGVAMEVATESRAASGSTGSRTGVASSMGDGCAHLVAFKAAAAASGTDPDWGPAFDRILPYEPPEESQPREEFRSLTLAAVGSAGGGGGGAALPGEWGPPFAVEFFPPEEEPPAPEEEPRIFADWAEERVWFIEQPAVLFEDEPEDPLERVPLGWFFPGFKRPPDPLYIPWDREATKVTEVHEQLTARIMNALLRQGDLVESGRAGETTWKLGYVPGNGLNWTGVPPISVEAALDRIAAALVALGQKP